MGRRHRAEDSYPEPTWHTAPTLVAPAAGPPSSGYAPPSGSYRAPHPSAPPRPLTGQPVLHPATRPRGDRGARRAGLVAGAILGLLLLVGAVGQSCGGGATAAAPVTVTQTVTETVTATPAPAPAPAAAAPAPAGPAPQVVQEDDDRDVAAVPAPAPAPRSAAPAPLVDAPDPAPAPLVDAPDPAPQPGAYYPNCDAARAAGAAPLLAGEPGYRSALDRDGDGVACE